MSSYRASISSACQQRRPWHNWEKTRERRRTLFYIFSLLDALPYLVLVALARLGHEGLVQPRAKVAVPERVFAPKIQQLYKDVRYRLRRIRRSDKKCTFVYGYHLVAERRRHGLVMVVGGAGGRKEGTS